MNTKKHHDIYLQKLCDDLIYIYQWNQCFSRLKLWVLLLSVERDTQCDKVWQYSEICTGTSLSSTNKTELNKITEIVLSSANNNQ
jgi:hypothetical protein